jgi:hypothetical protein
MSAAVKTVGIEKVTPWLFEKGRHISLHLPFEQGICRNPPVPPFEKGGRRGDLRGRFQKAEFILDKQFLG